MEARYCEEEEEYEENESFESEEAWFSQTDEEEGEEEDAEAVEEEIDNSRAEQESEGLKAVETQGRSVHARNKQGILEKLRDVEVSLRDQFAIVDAKLALRGQASSMLQEIQQQQKQQQHKYIEMVAMMEDREFEPEGTAALEALINRWKDDLVSHLVSLLCCTPRLVCALSLG